MKNSCTENDPAKENLGKEPSACDLHPAAGALHFSCSDINRRSAAIKAPTITTGLPELYLDQFSFIMECNIKRTVDSATCVCAIELIYVSNLFMHC